MKVSAQATRSGEWWAIRVPEVDGAFTQARRLDQVPGMAADAVATMLEVPATSIEVTVEYRLPDGLAQLVAQAREAYAAVDTEAQEGVPFTVRRAVDEMRDTYMSRADIAQLLDITYERASQLIHRDSSPSAAS